MSSFVWVPRQIRHFAKELWNLDMVYTNIGGGYINDTSSADYGKFIAPVKGTYLFMAKVYDADDKAAVAVSS